MDVSQILPSITTGDAVSNECFRMQEILKANGFSSDIYAEHIDPGLASKVINYKKYIDSEDKILIFHYSIGSDLTTFVGSLKCQKVMRYHNITPSEYFVSYNDQLVYLCNKGRNDLKMISNDFVGTIADSEFNKKELTEIGYKNVEVLPILLNFNGYINAHDNEYIINNFNNTENIIFVGKIAPHKAQKDLVKIFYYYYKYINKNSRLLLVGSSNGFEKYYNELLELIKILDLKNVVITGKVSFNDLVSYYRCADLFLCVSEHEGFCVPIVESMIFHVPIIAYNSTAIPSTLGKSGILFNDKHKYIEIAEMIDIVLNDKTLESKIILKQDERLNEFSEKSVEDRFKLIINYCPIN
jgi:glycosyltransferase involved in cell wall biosynthesis